MDIKLAVHDFKSQRLFVGVDLYLESAFECSRDQANYLLNVMRLKSGDEILVFNGRDGEWRARIEAIGRKKCNLIPISRTRKQPPSSGFTYCFAPLKQARLDYMVQKAVEMGAGQLLPVITHYTQVRSINEKRVHANVIEAAEQCGILSLPEISEPVPLSRLRDYLNNDQLLYFCDEDSHQIELEKQGSISSPFALLIGPEGGFSDEERKEISAWPNVTKLGLGPRILRADTAAVAAMAVLQARLGDWYK